MRWHFWTGAVLAGALAAPAHAESGPYRRFTEPVMDVNRNNRIIYAPVVWAFPDWTPPDMPHDVSAASWDRVPFGVRNEEPTRKNEDANYLLEIMEVVSAGRGELPRLRVVITRQPAPPEETVPPELLVVDPESLITVRSYADMDPIPGGMRYTFLVEPPPIGFMRLAAPNDSPVPRYSLRFRPARNVALPEWYVRAPTWGGQSIQTRMAKPPPRLPYLERVAGKRIEHRTGRIVWDPEKREKIAGKREEVRRKR